MGSGSAMAVEITPSSSEPVMPVTRQESLEQDLESHEASTALVHLCDLVGSTASSVPLTQRTFIKCLE